MNLIGPVIESRRKLLGLTRQQLAERLGVSTQTVLNVERDPGYNLGTTLLKHLEEALGVEFTITMTEVREMSSRITMGNDEFILFIRKIFPQCQQTNAQLGKSIWIWIRDNASGTKTVDDQPCYWGDQTASVSDTQLPATATQFEFEISALPDLYRFLISEGSK